MYVYELPDYVYILVYVSIHTVNSIGVIIGVVGVVAVMLTLIVVLPTLVFFKSHQHKPGNVLLFCVMLCSHVVMMSDVFSIVPVEWSRENHENK